MSGIAKTTAFYALLVGLAVLVNAAGYVLSLWHDETIFDEAVHLYTSFAVLAAVGWLATRGARWRGTPPKWSTLVGFGILLGLAWEAVEWIAGVIGGGRDTLMDLAMDAAGAALAAALLNHVFGGGRH